MNLRLTRAETWLAACAACLAILGVFAPGIQQPDSYHDFADKAAIWGIPFAMDVLSNIAFLVVGALGLHAMRRAWLRLGAVERAMAVLFFAGLVITAGASSWYHLRPDDAGLVIDRLGMGIAFSGLLGLAAATCVSRRAGLAMGVVVLLLSPLAVRHWVLTGDVTPWAVLQTSGALIVLVCAALAQSPARSGIRWGWVVLMYALAKVLELNDQQIFDATAGAISGHSLKHLAAAAAAWPVGTAMAKLGRLRDNPRNIENKRQRTMAHRAQDA